MLFSYWLLANRIDPHWPKIDQLFGQLRQVAACGGVLPMFWKEAAIAWRGETRVNQEHDAIVMGAADDATGRL